MSTLAQRSVGRGGDALDQIHIAGIAARGFHGVLASEREAGQDFSADVTLYLDTRPAARGDDLTETVNYALVAQDVADILSGAPVNLIETVAEQIAAAVLARPAVVAVDVAVHKPQAPIPVPFADVVVAIHRDRTSVAVASPVDGAVADLTGLEADAVEPEGVETVEEAPVRREPVPTATAVFPVVISRPAEPEGVVLGSVGAPWDAPVDGSVDAPGVALSDVLAAPLAAAATPVLMSAAAFASGPVPSAATPDASDASDAADVRATPDMPPVPFPASSETPDAEAPEEAASLRAPEQAPEPAEETAPDLAEEPVAERVDATADEAPATPPFGIGLTAVLPPLDDGVLAEQARLSEQARRPEVFGMATLSTEWAPVHTTDSPETPSLTAPEDFLTAEVVGFEDVQETGEPDDAVEADAVVAVEPDAPAVEDREVAEVAEVAVVTEAFEVTEVLEVSEVTHASVDLAAEPGDDAVLEAEDAALEADDEQVAAADEQEAATADAAAYDSADDADTVEFIAYADAPDADPAIPFPADAPFPTDAAFPADAPSDADTSAPGPEGDRTSEDTSDDVNATAILPRITDRMDAVSTEPVEVVIALGANLGDAQDTLRRAVAELDAISGLTITAVGPLARTAPVGGPDQPDFLNTVVLATTTLSPRELLHACQSIEAEHGRQRLEHWGPRTLDIDLIAYGGLVHSSDDLDIPHPRANERAFVLAPWAHLSPDAVLPGLGGGPVGALAATAPDREGIRWLALDWLSEPERAVQPPASTLPTRGGQSAGQRFDQSTDQALDQTDGEPAVVPPAPPL